MIIENLRAINADILALQEVWEDDTRNQAQRDRGRARLHRAGLRGQPRARRRPLRERGDLALADHRATRCASCRARARTTRSTTRAKNGCACSPRSTDRAGRSRCSARTSAGRTTTARSARSRCAEICRFVREMRPRAFPAVLCGDLNAEPHSDELRMLTGRAVSPVPRVVFRDAWEAAGNGGPGLHVVERQPVRGRRASISNAASTT